MVIFDDGGAESYSARWARLHIAEGEEGADLECSYLEQGDQHLPDIDPTIRAALGLRRAP